MRYPTGEESGFGLVHASLFLGQLISMVPEHPDSGFASVLLSNAEANAIDPADGRMRTATDSILEDDRQSCGWYE